jgi:hypothetical protein
LNNHNKRGLINELIPAWKEIISNTIKTPFFNPGPSKRAYHWALRIEDFIKLKELSNKLENSTITEKV